MSNSPLDVARACLQAYVDKDRAAIESLLAEDFHFTSPIDNALDRRTYLERSWPNSRTTSAVDFIYQAEQGEQAFVVYVARAGSKRFRNSEVHTVRDGKLVATEVYFGWDLPHRAAPGGFIENDGQGHA